MCIITTIFQTMSVLRTIYMNYFKTYPDTIRMNQVGGFYEVLGLDAALLNDLKNFKLTKRSMDKKDYVMTGFPIAGIQDVTLDLIKAKKRFAINSQTTCKGGVTGRGLEMYCSVGLSPLHSDHDFGPLCSIEFHGRETTIVFMDLAKKTKKTYHCVFHSKKTIWDIFMVHRPSEIIINGGLLTDEIYFGPNSSNPFSEMELSYKPNKPYLARPQYYTNDHKTKQVLSLAKLLNIQITPMRENVFTTPENALKEYISWSLPKSKPTDSLFSLKSIKTRGVVPFYTQSALEFKSLIPLINKTVSSFGNSEINNRLRGPFINALDIRKKQAESKIFWNTPKAKLNQDLVATAYNLQEIDKFNRSRFIAAMSMGKIHFPVIDDHLCKFVNMHHNTTHLIKYLSNEILPLNKDQDAVKTLRFMINRLTEVQQNYFPEITLHFTKNGEINETSTNDRLKALLFGINETLGKWNSFTTKLAQNGFILEEECKKPCERLKMLKKPKNLMNLEPVTKSVSNKQFTSTESLVMYKEYMELQNMLIEIKLCYAQSIQDCLNKSHLEIDEFESILGNIDVARSWSVVRILLNGVTWILPRVEGEIGHKFKKGTYPFFSDEFIPNDSANKKSIITISGCNMGGKSTYLKTLALIYLLGQVGGCVPCESCQLSPVDGIFLRTGTTDEIKYGKSSFYLEAEEITDIMKKSTRKSLVMVDEFGSSTSIGDAAVFLKKFLQDMDGKQLQCYLSTHTHPFCDFIEKQYKTSKHYHFKQSNSGYDHKLYEGKSRSSSGLEVLAELGIKIEDSDQEMRDALNGEIVELVRCKLN
eukprot:NODE_273_length_12179_cov_0.492632.p2 type:complete len:814 gc:universal NODE_273_length_12179_cov_0.492632:2677-236(-)